MKTLRKKKPIIVYSSSLIQQNHGESIHGHGWCDWDVSRRSFLYRELKNRYGYYTLRIENGVIPDYSDMPTNVRLRIFAGTLEQSDIKKLVTEIRSKHTVEELAVTNFEGAKQVGSTSAGNAILDIHDVNFQNKLIFDYLKEAMPNISEDTLERVLKLNVRLNEDITVDDLARKVLWRPISLKYHNLFTYGEDNFINFKSLNGVAGIFAPNASGKTSIADAICFALYDRTPRTSKGSSIMNYRKDSCDCEFRFEIEGVEYVIERTGKRNKKNEVKIDVNFYRAEKDGTTTSLNGEERRYTNLNIRNYVGDYEEFILTTLSSSSQTGLFVDRGQTDRKDLLSQFMGLNIFDKLYSIANDESKEVASALKRFKHDDFTQELATVEKDLDDNEMNVRAMEGFLNLDNTALNDITKDIQRQYEKKIPISVKPDSIYSLEQERPRVADIMVTATSALAKLGIELEPLAKLISTAEHKLAMEYVGVAERYAEYQNWIKQSDKAKHNTANCSTSLNRAKSVLNTLTKFQYDPNCVYCVSNGHTTISQKQETEQEIDRLETSLIEYQNEESKINDHLQGYAGIEEHYKKFVQGTEFLRATQQKERTLLLEKDSLTNKLQTATIRLNEIDSKIEEYNKHIETIKFNESVESDIKKLEMEKSRFKAQFNEHTSALQTYTTAVGILRERQQRMLDKIKEAEELETKYEVYESYLAAVGTNGLPYRLISEILPQVEYSVNNILAQMVDFALVFEMDGKNVNMRLSYDDERTWPLELASGMEKFVSGLAIRVALMSLSSLPKSNFLIIDEGLGALDGDNLSSMTGLFDVLRTKFDFILLISHVDSVRDISDQLLEIKRVNGFSQIEVL